MDRHQRGRPARRGVRRDQSEPEDSCAGRSRWAGWTADHGVRVRRHPVVPGREDRSPAAGRIRCAAGTPSSGCSGRHRVRGRCSARPPTSSAMRRAEAWMSQYAVDRYRREAWRLYGVLDARLAGRDHIADEFSIADIAAFPWVRVAKGQGVNLDDFPNVKRWCDGDCAASVGAQEARSRRRHEAGREVELLHRRDVERALRRQAPTRPHGEPDGHAPISSRTSHDRPTLDLHRMSIDGLSVAGDASLPVIDPATAAPFARVPDCHARASRCRGGGGAARLRQPGATRRRTSGDAWSTCSSSACSPMPTRSPR